MAWDISNQEIPGVNRKVVLEFIVSDWLDTIKFKGAELFFCTFPNSLEKIKGGEL